MATELATAVQGGIDWCQLLLAYVVGDGWLNDAVFSAVVFTCAWGALWLVKHQVIARLYRLAQRTRNGIDDFLLGLAHGVGGFFFLTVALFASVQHLDLPRVVDIAIRALFLFALVHEVIKFAEKVFVFYFSRSLRRHGKPGAEAKNVSAAIIVMVRMVLWTVGLLLILSNLHFNVNSLIASLGIGGLAISLALQNVFSDIFSSFSIVLDKPFEEGDFIVVGDHMGTVKQIGLKTTRIEALHGEEIIISNNELTSARIQNYKKLNKRRVLFTLGVTFDTAVEKLRAIPALIERIIRAQPNVEFDRVFFRSIGDASLQFEVVYYVLANEYLPSAQARQDINLSIMDVFRREGISMAFPTQTVHLVRE